MKKSTKFLVALGAMMTLVGSAFAQRQCNLAPTLVSPTNDQVVPFGDTLNVVFTIKNNGPNDILAGDTIFYAIGNSVYAQRAMANIANGATSAPITAPDFFLNDTTTDISGTLCVLLLDQSLITYNTTPPTPATITYHDADTTNDESCAAVTLKGSGVVGIFELGSGMKEQLNLYPNPANTEVMFNINLDKAEDVIVSVKDITGREVSRNNFGKINSGSATPFKINVANLNAGLYFIELNAGERRAIGKINVRH